MSPNPSENRENVLVRWLKFNFVGLGGMVVQTLVLALLANGLGVRDSVALMIGVECAVINNFWWHERWTWRERKSATRRERLVRLAQFNISNGLVSLCGAWVLMEVLHERFHLPNQLVNLISIVACSLINFGLSNSLVFRKRAGAETVSAK